MVTITCYYRSKRYYQQRNKNLFNSNITTFLVLTAHAFTNFCFYACPALPLYIQLSLVKGMEIFLFLLKKPN